MPETEGLNAQNDARDKEDSRISKKKCFCINETKIYYGEIKARNLQRKQGDGEEEETCSTSSRSNSSRPWLP